MSMVILRMVQLDARAKGAALPPETEKLFEKFENRDWKTQETRELMSIYADLESATTQQGNAASVDMGKFIKQMESLGLEAPKLS
ncbi:uncharacterized protein Z519_08841 [Cladophialophora bantiana CBS 173.52]|uniref:Uncharacterized protein n=1 Tax=Cladophialophora bantiana (strain ATCC 10958 / CBS 173.52 / CDC B-1940 / NIH 8579) TaxID=1442370 RepID=A0A0D2HAB2_CLAB1|nr:uncharacterized protein Z519_08841 [Cladophialophora bantiana CBS 173.52]KIW90198.1 hypothetical protein Z519_08841 [Cladophialophora bantiana CBS 173.52]